MSHTGTRSVLLLLGIIGALAVLVATDVIETTVAIFERCGELPLLGAILLAGLAIAGSMIRDPWSG